MKPTKQQILNEPAGPRIDAWFAKLVMGWRLEEYQDREWNFSRKFRAPKKTYQRWVTCSESCDGIWAKPTYHCDHIIHGPFEPSTNSAHAMEGVLKFVSLGTDVKIMAWLCDRAYVKVGNMPNINVGLHEIPLAATRALLLWAIEKGK